MQKQIQVYENKEFGKIRVIEVDGQPWFVGKDLAEVLGYENGSRDIKRHVDINDIRTEMIPQYRNGTLVSKAVIINESGLYALIFGSKLPAAKIFTRWVTKDVLPSLRKHGAYVTDNTLRQMREDKAFSEDLLKRLGVEQAKNEALLDFVNSTAPKLRYYDSVLQSTSALQVSIIAKDYGMSAVAFNNLLHSLGIQYKIGKTWLLYSDFTNNGYTISRTKPINGKETVTFTCWTQKGRCWLYDVLKWYGVLPLAEKNEGS